MTRDDEPTFYGIDILGTIAAVLFCQVESTVEQLETILEVEHRRVFHVLDSETLDPMNAP